MKQTTCFDFMGRSIRIIRRPPRRAPVAPFAGARRRHAAAGAWHGEIEWPQLALELSLIHI